MLFKTMGERETRREEKRRAISKKKLSSGKAGERKEKIIPP